VEREITEERALCTPKGLLAPEAVGWSRRPLHVCNLSGRFPRKKRWDYWAATNTRQFLALFVADIDYLGIGLVTFTDLEKNRRFERVAITPLGAGCRLPERAGEPVHFARFGVAIDVSPTENGSRIAVRANRFGKLLTADFAVGAPRDSLNVVVPWNDRQFQFTSKQIGLPLSGTLQLAGESFSFDGGYAALDFGRGIWPHKTAWHWAAAAGESNGRALAFNLGARWTDHTGSTENGLFRDGALTKISEDVSFNREADHWTIKSQAIDLRFTPIHERKASLPLGPLGARLHWCAGRFTGHILDETLTDLFGWCESFDARW